MIERSHALRLNRWTRFWTTSGSEYLVDHAERVWRRGDNQDSPKVRTSNGVFYFVSEIEAGYDVIFICPPIVDGSAFRLIRTTRVVRVSQE
jgi:hypothetical protein